MTLSERYNRLSIAGVVTRADTEMALENARIEIVQGPEQYEVWRRSKQAVSGMGQAGIVKRIVGVDLTFSRTDGTYRFLNLPAGTYDLRCSMKRPTRLVPATLEAIEVTETGDDENSLPPMTNFVLQVR
ncbi:MAG: hypothetical protein AAFR81_13760 [Chloroflexota bacterium]